MTNAPALQVTIDFRDANLPEEQLDRLTANVLKDLKALDEVEKVERVPDPQVPDGGMGGGTLMGLLTAEVSLQNIRALAGYLTGKFTSKPIDLEIEVSDQNAQSTQSRKIKLTGVRPEDLDRVVAAAERLAAGQDPKNG